eukprot:TRINITY_DN6143_c0_g1_i2.p1 TRINITY_DN6143_c0_g1~~TRINITY_DN6143_c0_g1_i2.p1  ORF type:complete len:667 (-),score=144.19 TRINITY_DN6143_c0_g1_i2:214-2214(-)
MDRQGDGEHIALPCHQPRPLDEIQALPAPMLDEPLPEPEKELASTGLIDLGDDEENSDPNKENRSSEVQEKSAGKGKGQGRGRGKKNTKAKGVDKEGGKKKEKAKEDVTALDTWTPEKFVQLCIFCGTDYKEHDVHIKGLGIKTAFKLLCRHNDAQHVVEFISTNDKWKDKLPCEAAEYMQRFVSIFAVFLHHVVFDPRKGECVSITTAFPHTESLRHLPNLDLPALCGAGSSKEEAGRVARGEMNPRTKQPRKMEPLTPAERAILDRMLAEKRREQRDHQFNLELKERAEEIKAEKAVAAAAAASEDALSPAQKAQRRRLSISERLANNAESEDAPVDDDEEKPKTPREFGMLSGDLKFILGLRDEITKDEMGQQLTPQRPPDASQSATATPPANGNPFARRVKRGPATQGHDSDVLSKRPRVMAAQTVSGLKGSINEIPLSSSSKVHSCEIFVDGIPFDWTLEKLKHFFLEKCGDVIDVRNPTGEESGRLRGTAYVTLGSNSARDKALALGGTKIDPKLGRYLKIEIVDARGAASQAEKPQRQMVAPQIHKRGGYAAKDAVSAVLAQRGAPELAPLEASKDKSKLTSFFRSKGSEAQKSKSAQAERGRQTSKDPATAETKSSLKSWNPRPWETPPADEDADPFVLSANPLSMMSNRRKFFFNQS